MTETAEVLRTAAKLMKEGADLATPGPWHTHPGNRVSDNVRADGRLVIDGGGWSEDGGGKPVVYGAALTADAAYIASMSPAVAMAVAALLNELAEHADHGRESAFVLDGLDVARAYLGRAA